MIVQISYWFKDVLKGKAKSVLMSISLSSYIIYLFHTTFEGFSKSIVHKIPMMNGDNQILFVIGAIFVISCGTVIPIFLHKYILTKSRVTRVLFGLK